MIYETLALPNRDKSSVFLKTYLISKNSFNPERKRPLVLIVPGGGYEHFGEREQEPVAVKMNALGFHAAILHYSLAPMRFPDALCDVANAVALIRQNAEDWAVDSSKIILCGFSAGGHLAASLGCFWSSSFLKKYVPPKETEGEPVEEIQSFTESVATQNPAEPKLSVGISPQYFSPDGDGEYDDLTIMVKAECESPMQSWTFTVEDPATLKPFWVTKGTTELPPKIIWNGKSARGEVVQSATDYPYEFTVTDSNNLSSTVKGFVKVDVLVIRDGERIKMQVPSIIFRSDAADFKTTEELSARPDYDGITKGLNQRTLENNVKILGRISEILKKFRDYTVTIEGNANNLSGTQEEEDEVKLLSEQRAKYVRDWLVKDGVPSANLKAVGNGSKNPATSSTATEDRWKNRRVEFILKK